MELLVVGLDGLSPNMLREFDVDTPFLDEVRSTGVSGDLESVDTPTTLPAWTSFATGVDPGSHGISTMLEQAYDYSISPASCDTTHPAIYDLLDDAVFINLPASVEREPAGEDVHLVSSILSSGPEDAVPPALRSLDTFDDYIVHDDASLKSSPESYVEHLRETARSRYTFAAEAFDRYDPRVGFVLFSTPDWVGHFLQFGDRAKQERWYRSVVELVDERAKHLADRAENVILLSDHGFEHKPWALHLQDWLADGGYLERNRSDSPLQRLATGTAKRIAKRFGPLFDVLRSVYLRVTNMRGGENLGNVINLNPEIDFAASTAWHLRYGCLYLNDDDFESSEVRHPDTLRRELHDQLAILTDGDGDPVFESVNYPEEAYSDPNPAHRLPDLIARPASGVLPLRAFSPTGDFVTPTPGHDHYDHRYRGMIAADGPLFASGTVDGMSIVDVLPTVLHALGEPLAPAFDGRRWVDILATDTDPSWIEESGIPEPRIRTDDDTTDRDITARKQLAELGYLE